MGPYNNETSLYEDVDGYERGHWYVKDNSKELFIVPDAEAEIEGPDGEMLEALNAIYRKASFKDIAPFAVADSLGLSVIADTFKRFDPQVGYFCA